MIRDHFVSDHRTLEAWLLAVGAALDRGDDEKVERYWTKLESGLLAHMDAEEASLIPALQARSDRHARVLIHDHRHLRSRLAELGAARAAAAPTMARDFIHDLQAHARSEENILYTWADEHLADTARAAAIAKLADCGLARRAPRTL